MMESRKFYENLLNGVTMDAEVVEEFAKHQIALLDKKKASNEARKIKRAEAHTELEAKIMEIISTVSCVCCKDIAVELGLSVQKVAPRMNALADRGELVKNIDKKVAYFSIPKTKEVEDTEA